MLPFFISMILVIIVIISFVKKLIDTFFNSFNFLLISFQSLIDPSIVIYGNPHPCNNLYVKYFFIIDICPTANETAVVVVQLGVNISMIFLLHSLLSSFNIY